MRNALLLAACVALAPQLAAQNGDVAGEAQPELPADLLIPPATALSWEEQLASFRLPPGFAIELVASEPLVGDPVAMSFGADGRLWVAEMRGYMNDLAGTREDAPVGVIAVLADEDGDGRMDTRTVFAEGLVLPRALALTREGLLVIAPPELLFLRDTDEDGISDERTVVDRGLAGVASPEHAINGLLPTLDNRFANANAPWSYVWREKRFQRETGAGGGQWGITQDDRGRLYHDNNSDPLRGDRIPGYYAARNQNLGLAAGVNRRIVSDMSVRPSRITPGVNRGYREGFLKDGKLVAATGTCAPWIYRGGTFPKPFAGAAFVCEPTANLVLAYALDEKDGELDARVLRHGEPELDFLTSTDERFRPVFLCDGPDGSLYVADMYRGLIQHRLFVTSFLEKQVRARGLEQPIGRGRIWRVRNSAAPRRAAPALAEATWAELAAALELENGWVRDRVQQIFVEEGLEEAKAHTLLQELLANSKQPLARLHALWALAGMRGVTPELSRALLADPDERVREAAVRTSEGLVGSDPTLLAQWLALARGDTQALRAQVLLSLGEVHTDAAERAILQLLLEDAAKADERSWAISSLARRELAFLELLLNHLEFEIRREGRPQLLTLLATTLAREGNHANVSRALEFVVEGRRPGWQREALIAGLLQGRTPPSPNRPAALRLVEEPRAYAMLNRLASQVDPASAAPMLELANSLSWPGHPLAGETPVRVLEPAERAAFERGRQFFAMICAGCHQSSGQGMAGMAPSLRGSPWLLGDPTTAARIVLQGLEGPIVVDGATWDLSMPAVVGSDSELADVLTYVRREWGHSADPLTSEFVKGVRAADKARQKPWTATELDAQRR